MRQIVLDTETTGLEPDMGHRIIEIGAVEVINRRLTGRHFHKYLNPERDVDDGAYEVHGLSREFLSDKPLFADVFDEFVEFVRGGELVIHNAPFDVSFLDYEIKTLARNQGAKLPRIHQLCEITDSLALAIKKHPGQRNNLDALCRRYEVDNSQRQLHGALLDAEILADVYLLMTGGQTSLFGASNATSTEEANVDAPQEIDRALEALELVVVQASPAETEAHEQYLDFLGEQSGATALWRELQQQQQQ